MSEDRSHLIEIGDPEADPVVPGPVPAPQVVIEYRDRGLPWMLVLPLLVTAAAVAIIAFKAFDDRVRPSPISLAEAIPAPAPPSVAEVPPLPSFSPTLPEGVARDPGGMSLPAPSPVALPLASIPAEAAIPDEPAPSAPPAVVEVPPPAEPAAPAVEEPRPFPQVAANGFDPGALARAEAKPDAPDDVRPAGHPAEVREPERPAAVPDEPEQPRTVDPRDLPRDPRQARRERMLRWAEARKKLDEDRVRFHAELRAISKRFGANAAPAIADLCRRYGTEPDPIAKAEAARMLTVAAAGVDPAVRVRLLRSFGFPEASILIDIAETKGRWEDGKSRNGPRTQDDILRRAALFLLQCPPGKGPASARPTSARPTGPIR